MMRVSLLGSTGSIGTSTLDVLAGLPERFEVECLSAGSNIDLLCDQVKRFRPKRVCVGEEYAKEAGERNELKGLELLHGPDGLIALATDSRVDLVINGLVAGAGLRPTLAAVEAGRDVAIANKETLVVAGHLVTELAARNGVRLIPLDSELTPLWQNLQGVSPQQVTRIVLSASGGPFFDMSLDEMARATPEEALRHPTWRMGPKITIDSATLMNKGFEVIESRWFLGLDIEQIDVVIHRQSIVHCLVEFLDGSLTAHLSHPDMRLPIQQALTHPERLPTPVPSLDLVSTGSLSFHAPDLERFPCLALAYEVCREGGTAAAVLNAANEIGVYAFLAGRIGFLDVPDVVRRTLDAHVNASGANLDAVFEADRWGREKAREIVAGLNR
ncbi:MAG: 1-deoxy-D-xylulose-5-phosphate reductoisomerase [Gemmatimonadota bacterium]|nr:1-deoxy-D-xylulose-5-phosphate reductoisomerase [Gemmatimonadota bacterium]